MQKSKVIVSKDACPGLLKYLEEGGHEVMLFGPLEKVAPPVANHPDLIFCGISAGVVFQGDPERLSPKYPGDVIYNGCSTGEYFIHDLRVTDPGLLDMVKRVGLRCVNVRQGYSRCSVLPVDGTSIITYDKGIDLACRAAGLSVLRIRPGHVLLPGYNEGFIGGTAGRVGDEILFNGDLSSHPDFGAIHDFISERDLGLKYFADHPLTDIGSIIEAEIINNGNKSN
ncbi:MAG: hypothetical protein IJT40_03535 [Firmicutes bacterium]|nr:hypothetical protein [Bacillota bacterium]